MGLRQLMGQRKTIIESMNNDYIDDIIKLFNKNSRVRIKIVATRVINEAISEDFTDLVTKIKMKKLDVDTKGILKDLVGMRKAEKEGTDYVQPEEGSKPKQMTIDDLKELLLDSYSITDTDYDVIEMVIMLDPDSYFKEGKVDGVKKANLDMLTVLKKRGYKLYVDDEIQSKLDEMGGHAAEPKPSDTSLIPKKMIMPTKRKQIMKINGSYKILPLQKYRKFSLLNGIVTVRKPITDTGGGILKYFSIVQSELGVYNIEFMKISTNVMEVLGKYENEPDVEELLSDGTLTESYLAHVNDAVDIQQSKQMKEYLDQVPYEDVVEAINILNGVGKGVSKFRFDTNFTIVIELLRKIYMAVGKQKIKTDKETGKVLTNFKMNNVDKINIKPNTLITIFKNTDNSLTESLSNVNSLTITSSMKYRDLSTKEKTFLMENTPIEDPMCVVVNANSHSHNCSIPLFMDISLIE